MEGLRTFGSVGQQRALGADYLESASLRLSGFPMRTPTWAPVLPQVSLPKIGTLTARRVPYADLCGAVGGSEFQGAGISVYCAFIYYLLYTWISYIT